VLPCSRYRLLAALALTLVLCSCKEDPAGYDDLSLGAFNGMNAGLLGKMITFTTNVAGDTATAVVVAGEIGHSRLSGDEAPARDFRGIALFSVGGTASEVGGVSANGVPLRWVPNAPPAHYELDTTAEAVIAAERRVQWNAGWTTGESILATAGLPPSFGTISLSVGRQMSVAALDAGQDVTISWSGIFPANRVFIYASWQPKVFAPTLVVAPVPILIVEDAGAITIPGERLKPRGRQPDGRLTFGLYRGVYDASTSFDNGTKTIGTFSYVADSVRVDLVE
jgi:hypothetical protein